MTITVLQPEVLGCIHTKSGTALTCVGFRSPSDMIGDNNSSGHSWTAAAPTENVWNARFDVNAACSQDTSLSHGGRKYFDLIGCSLDACSQR